MAGNRACRLTYHMFENYEPRTHRDRSVTLAFIHRSHNKMPFDFVFFFFFLFDLALAFRMLSHPLSPTFFPLSLSFSRSLSKLRSRMHFIHLIQLICRMKDARTAYTKFVLIFYNFARIVTDRFLLHFTPNSHRRGKALSSKNYVSAAIFATKWKIIDNT